MPGWVDIACKDYLKRLPREMDVQMTSIALAHRQAKNSVENFRREETSQIIKKISPDSFSIALDEHGRQWSSMDWSVQLEQWMQLRPRINIIIGGPDGLNQECLDKCQQSISLGPVTMPHALVRILLLEQLYRAWSILKGHPYHRE